MGFGTHVHANDIKHLSAQTLLHPSETINIQMCDGGLSLRAFQLEDVSFDLQFDKTHNERDTIKSTKVLHCNSSKL